MDQDKLNKMEYYYLGEALKDKARIAVEQYISETCNVPSDEAMDITYKTIDGLIDRCVEQEEFITSLVIFSTISTLDNASKLVDDKWLPELGEDDE